MTAHDRPTRRQFMGRSLVFAGAVSLGPVAARTAEKEGASGTDPPGIDVSSRLELMTDDALIDRTQGVRQRLHHPVPQDVAIVHDAPWEGTGSGYHSVFQDGDRYRMYYRGSPLDVSGGTLKHGPSVLCYAESADGIGWRKPELGLVEVNGSKQNNVLLKSGGYEGLALPLDGGHLAVFRDENPDADPEARYKGLIGVQNESALYAFGSADGLVWRPLASEPVLTGGQFDSQNTAFWDPEHHIYRTYCRSWSAGRYAGVRGIRTATSPDFRQWSEFRPLELPGSDSSEHLYTNGIKPYPRAPHVLLGFPARYIERGWSDSMRALPELALRQQRAKAHLRYGTALTESLLISSRDGQTFHRWPEAFLRPGPERPGTWQYGQQYIAWHLVETCSALDPQLRELSLYATERKWHGPGTLIRRYTLRLDGFVSMHAPLEGGEFVSRPLVFAGRELRLNFATSAAGSIRVELQDPAGEPIPGFSLAECNEVFGDALARPVTWKEGRDLGALAGKPMRLRFELKDADLFALRFAAD